jgi:hypothetical protein
MKKHARIVSRWTSWSLVIAYWIAVPSSLRGEGDDVLFIQAVPAQAVAPAAVVIKQEEVKAADKVAKEKKAAKATKLAAPINYPTLYPNPLAFNLTWVTVTTEKFVQARQLAARQKAMARRAAVRRPPAIAVAQNGVQQQMRKLLEPGLTTELSFAARVMDLNREERRKLSTDGKVWFEKFLVDYLKKQDPNQQQMLLQGMQGVWFGNQQQRPESPRDAIRIGIAKLVKDMLPKEKVAAYTDECKKRDEFARQTSVDNLVERIDEKVKLSPDQWKKLTKTLNEHWDKNHDPQLESFALNQSMWPGAPDQWVQPLLSPAQQAVLKRINNNSGQMFINGGIFGQMFGGDVAVFDDIDGEAIVEVAEPPAGEPAETSEAE